VTINPPAQTSGVLSGSLGIMAFHIEQSQTDRGSLRFGELQPGQWLREAGHVGQGQLEVEEALMELLAGRSVIDGGGIAQLGIDHQGSLVEPQQVALESRHAARIRVRAVEQVED
jgi:hypothetical protein